MFNGKVQFKGKIIEVIPLVESNIQVSIAIDKIDYKFIKRGNIMLHNGCSLTVSNVFDNYHQVVIYKETLACTTGLDQVGNTVNIEPALKVGDPLYGNFITGLIDGTATVYNLVSIGECKTVIFQLSPDLSKYLVNKSAIVINGVSLTIEKTYQDKFEVILHPRTLSTTNLGQLYNNSKVNVEIDQIAKYVYQFMTRK